MLLWLFALCFLFTDCTATFWSVSLLLFKRQVVSGRWGLLMQKKPTCSWCMESLGRMQFVTVYVETYPNRLQPSRQLFINLFNQLRESGTVTPRKRNRNKQVTGEEAEINVLAAVAVDPQISSRTIACGSGISQASVLRILHRHRFHPCHISLHQELLGNNFENRVNFCTWALRHDTPDSSCILFSDKATFTNHGQVNCRNMHYQSVDNPHWLRQVERQRPWSLNCGVG